jgi:hydrogenase expression/formation protein HypE
MKPQIPGSGMPAGKLPNRLLSALLGKITHRDERVIAGPGVGRDAAVIDSGGPRLLVAKADPITFATDMIGWYAVHVNANDIACMGARPAWFMATILLPEGCEPGLAESVFGQVTAACDALGIELVGGHTEITYRLERPIVAGAMLGEVEREGLVRPENARPGDALILTKGIAIEGTLVLAREAPDALRRMGVSAKTIDAARRYIGEPGISVVAEAMAACAAVPVHAMHDPTEGGLATALYELAEACGVGVAVERDAIEVLLETRIISEAAGLDPLGLLASGALLIAVAEEDAGPALRAIEQAGIPARRIGTLTEAGGGVIISGNGTEAAPQFPRDEVARFLTRHAG